MTQLAFTIRQGTAVDASQDHQHHAAGDVDGDLRVPGEVLGVTWGCPARTMGLPLYIIRWMVCFLENPHL